LFRFEQRGNYDREILRSLYDELPRDVSGKVSTHRAEAHRRFIAMARRRAFFERRDTGWRAMLPYKTADDLLAVVRGDRRPDGLLEPLLVAINRGEGSRGPSASATTSRSRCDASTAEACARTAVPARALLAVAR
jgi:hypothetical protein